MTNCSAPDICNNKKGKYPAHEMQNNAQTHDKLQYQHILS